MFVSIQASGGSGDYVWKTTDSSVASVNVKGEITTGKKGFANVTAADARNSAHKGTAEVGFTSAVFKI